MTEVQHLIQNILWSMLSYTNIIKKLNAIFNSAEVRNYCESYMPHLWLEINVITEEKQIIVQLSSEYLTIAKIMVQFKAANYLKGSDSWQLIIACKIHQCLLTFSLEIFIQVTMEWQMSEDNMPHIFLFLIPLLTGSSFS